MNPLRFAVPVIGVALAACGDPHEETGVCRDQPCLTWIDEERDWAAVSVPYTGDGRCDLVEESKFIAPATGGAALQEVVFQDVGTHALHLDFMTQVLPAYFGGLSPTTYQQIVQRRATRQYWAGALFRIAAEDGTTEGYGFDVVTDLAGNEDISAEEIAAVHALLRRRFELPLVYAPTSIRAIFTAANVDTPTHLPRVCAHTTCPTDGVDCVVVPAELAACTQFLEGRTLDGELAAKARFTIAAQTLELPRGAGTTVVPDFLAGGEHGAARTPIVPAGAARYVVESSPAGGFANRIEQDVTIEGAAYQVTAYVGVPDGGGGHLVDAFTGASSIGALRRTGETAAEILGACAWGAAEHWQIRGELGAGDHFTLDFAYRPRFFGSSPLTFTRAEVTLDGVTTVVDDYFALVYAGEHHNWNNQFWVRFPAPVQFRGRPVDGIWLDQVEFGWDFEAMHTVDADRQPLDALDVTGYVVEQVR